MVDKMIVSAIKEAGVAHDLALEVAARATAGATRSELLLEGQFAQEVRPSLADLYAIAQRGGLDNVYGSSRQSIKNWVIAQYRENGDAALGTIGAVLSEYARRSFNLGGQFALNDLELLAEFELTDPRLIRAINRSLSKYTNLTGQFSLARSTADEIAVRLDNQYQAGNDIERVINTFGTWALGRTIIRSANIAADQAVRMNRWGLASAFVGNGISEVMHICEPDVDDLCTSGVCPPLCGNIYQLRGVFNPMASIGADRIPLHPNCRCTYDPIKEGWIKPAIIWTGFALDF